MKSVKSEEMVKMEFQRLKWRVHLFKRDLGERIKKSKCLLARRVYAVDPHTHSIYSDGTGAISENRAAAANAGLDFFFATDHASLKQKRPVAGIPEASWGQEPGAGYHHICLLENKRLFKPGRVSVAETLAKARSLAKFVFIPHPTGWYPGTYYSDAAIDLLWTLGDEFAVEVLNGASKVFNAYDRFDAHAVEVWDRLLSEGKRVTPLGSSDSHGPEGFGTAFTGVYAASRKSPSIIKALNAGKCFASEASVMSFSCRGRDMGEELKTKSGSKVKFKCRVADAEGLTSVRLVSGGKVRREINVGGEYLFDSVIETKVSARDRYFRLESTAIDNRRCFSAPIYLKGS